ncbi:MAG: hypothetical protein JWO22_2651 [Frankiales bacterium]|nr:hypothetical protein [Frankiales bacterium]
MRIYPLVALADTLLAASGRHRERCVTKPLLMPALLAGKPRPIQRALALGGAGDVALLGTSDLAFTAGLGSFLAGHVAWMAALRPRSRGAVTPARAAPYLAAWVGLNAFLWKRTGKDRVPVLAYSAALMGTALAGLDTGDPAVAAGGLLFVASDTMLSLERFAGVHLPLHEGLVMASYTAAQALLASD